MTANTHKLVVRIDFQAKPVNDPRDPIEVELYLNGQSQPLSSHDAAAELETARQLDRHNAPAAVIRIVRAAYDAARGTTPPLVPDSETAS